MASFALRTQRRPVRLALWLLVCLAAWWGNTGTARAQAARRIELPQGMVVAVPAQLREAPPPARSANTGSRLERLLSDGAAKPLFVAVQVGPEPAIGSLSLEPDERTEAIFDGLLSNLPGAYDVRPGTYAPERSALALDFEMRGASLVSGLLAEPDTGPFWTREAARSGVEPRRVRCLYAELLGGAQWVTEVQLRAHYAAAASRCELPVERVELFATTTGAAAFGAQVSTVSAVVFLSKLGTVAVLSSAPVERTADARATAAFILSNTEVAPEVRLPVVRPSFEVGRLLGVTLGALLGGLALMAGMAWLLVKAGLEVRLALGLAGAAAVGLGIFGVLRSALALDATLQLLSYLVASGITYHFLGGWLRSHSKAGLRPAAPRGRA